MRENSEDKGLDVSMYVSTCVRELGGSTTRLDVRIQAV